MRAWKLKRNHETRARAQHPWVFSNELMDSPKGITAGEEVELQDMMGRFLARGYGNSQSLISFRAMSFNAKEDFRMTPAHLTARLLKAWKYRFNQGFRESFRLCYSEADQMPGLIFDRYVFEKAGKKFQVFSYQLLTSGMDTAFKKDGQGEAILKNLAEEALTEKFSDITWTETIILQRNDVNIRKLEGLIVEEPVILKTVGEEDLTDIAIHIQSVLNRDQKILFNVNLPDGQKTGFFLDQTLNIQLLLRQLETRKDELKGKTVRILDLCCYMGQWSAQIVHHLKQWGAECEVHLVDVSELALKKASQNLSAFQVPVATYKKDVLAIDAIPEFQKMKFDIIISDPPAFVKNKKDINAGLAAYTKLNGLALKLCGPQALIVSCTCSGAVKFEDFKEAVGKAVIKSGVRAKCVGYGSQGLDHPHSLNFPEGYYLKMILQQIDS